MLQYKPKEENKPQVNGYEEYLKNKKIQEQGTALKTKTIQNQTRLKSILQVFMKGDKFYIEQGAAYALKFTNVRAIMLDKPRYYEIGVQEMAIIKNNRDISVEYVDLNKEKEQQNEKVETTKEEVQKSEEHVVEEPKQIEADGEER